MERARRPDLDLRSGIKERLVDREGWAMADSFHLFPPNPYPLLTSTIAHRVWILDCRSCDAFLTNRAMKAVLLLRPNVSLFSSDALPAGCSPYSASPDPARPSASQKSASSARTCECLTQNLCCHTCGTAVGYKIVLPCTRCTSSIGATNRATNGHRFVFHSTEVVGTERHYIQDEPGVVPFDPPVFLSHPIPAPSSSAYYPHPRSASPPVFRSEYLPTPPLEFAVPAYAAREYDLDPSSHYTRFYSHRSYQPHVPSQPYPTSPRSPEDHPFPASPSTYSSAPDSPPPLLSPSIHHFHSADQKEPLHPPPSLKPGDVIFWHHLARKGEVPGVIDDLRARYPAAATTHTDILFNR